MPSAMTGTGGASWADADQNRDVEHLVLLVSIKDAPFQRLAQANNIVFTHAEYGFDTCTWDMSFNFDTSLQNILALDSQVVLLPPWGYFGTKVAWEGIISGYEPVLKDNEGTIRVSALGRWAHNDDNHFLGSLQGSPETMLKYLINNGYLPHLSSDTSQIIATGLPEDRVYLSDGAGGFETPISDVITSILLMGASTPGQRMIAHVWENGVLSTEILSTTPTPRYSVSRGRLKNVSVKRDLMSVANRVQVKANFGGILTSVIKEDTAGQAALAAYYRTIDPTTHLPTRSQVNFKRTKVVDVTGAGVLTVMTQPDNTASMILNRTKYVQNESSQALLIDRDYSVYDLVLGRYIPNWLVRPGCWIQVPDLSPADAFQYGSDTPLGAINTFYTTATSYKVDTGELEITPEASSRIADLIAGKGM